MVLPLAALGRPLADAFYPSAFFNKGVLSFAQNLPTAFSLGALQQWYATSDPLHPALLFCSVVSFLVWAIGEATGNVSQVDRLWTFLPVAYSVHFTFFPKWSGTGELEPRMLLLLGLQLLWAARLTRNTYIRGFFNPSTEDYRWEYQKQKMNWIGWKLLNIFFIAIAQNLLLAAGELPQYLLLTLTPRYSPKFVTPPLGIYDAILSVVFIGILVVESVGDIQQQRYQAFKAEAKRTGRKLTPKEQGKMTRGFITSGVWAYSRHPNFACEQATWYILYLFTIVPFIASPIHRSTLSLTAVVNAVSSIASFADFLAVGRALQGTLWNYSIWGPLTMSMLFYGSTDITEEISAGKYPLYKQYQRRVGQFWPPITTLKGIYLTLTGKKNRVEDACFGGAVLAGAKKQQ